jgi:hypothetical protein
MVHVSSVSPCRSSWACIIFKLNRLENSLLQNLQCEGLTTLTTFGLARLFLVNGFEGLFLVSFFLIFFNSGPE